MSSKEPCNLCSTNVPVGEIFSHVEDVHVGVRPSGSIYDICCGDCTFRTCELTGNRMINHITRTKHRTEIKLEWASFMAREERRVREILDIGVEIIQKKADGDSESRSKSNQMTKERNFGKRSQNEIVAGVLPSGGEEEISDTEIDMTSESLSISQKTDSKVSWEYLSRIPDNQELKTISKHEGGLKRKFSDEIGPARRAKENKIEETKNKNWDVKQDTPKPNSIHNSGKTEENSQDKRFRVGDIESRIDAEKVENKNEDVHEKKRRSTKRRANGKLSDTSAMNQIGDVNQSITTSLDSELETGSEPTGRTLATSPSGNTLRDKPQRNARLKSDTIGTTENSQTTSESRRISNEVVIQIESDEGEGNCQNSQLDETEYLDQSEHHLNEGRIESPIPENLLSAEKSVTELKPVCPGSHSDNELQKEITSGSSAGKDADQESVKKAMYIECRACGEYLEKRTTISVYTMIVRHFTDRHSNVTIVKCKGCRVEFTSLNRFRKHRMAHFCLGEMESLKSEAKIAELRIQLKKTYPDWDLEHSLKYSRELGELTKNQIHRSRTKATQRENEPNKGDCHLCTKDKFKTTMSMVSHAIAHVDLYLFACSNCQNLYKGISGVKTHQKATKNPACDGTYVTVETDDDKKKIRATLSEAFPEFDWNVLCKDKLFHGIKLWEDV